MLRHQIKSDNKDLEEEKKTSVNISFTLARYFCSPSFGVIIQDVMRVKRCKILAADIS